jgi:hypothetical protein
MVIIMDILILSTAKRAGRSRQLIADSLDAGKPGSLVAFKLVGGLDR